MAVKADSVIVELKAARERYDRDVADSARKFDRAMKDTAASATKMERSVAASSARVTADLERRWSEVGDGIGRGIQNGSRIAQVAFAGITAYAIKLAADASEIENAFEVAFKNSAAEARAFSEVLATNVGRDAVVAREAMSRLQLVITGTGVASKQSTELVKALTARAVDIGSLFNVKDAEAFSAILSGLTGETEPLKRFGAVLNETAVKAELLRLGFKGNAEQASEAAKTIARANLILAKTAVAQGDAAKTADSAANATKRAKAEFDKAARSLGEQLLPAATKAAGALTSVLKSFNSLPEGTQLASLAILGFVAAGGPIASLLLGLGRVIKLAGETRIALAGLTGANVAAGVGGAGAAAGVGAGALAGGPVTVGVLGSGALYLNNEQRKRYDKIVAKPSAASDADLAFAIDFARSNSNGGRGGGAVVSGNARKYGADQGRLLSEQLNRGLGGGAMAPPAASTAPTGFTLPTDLMNGSANGGGGGRRGAGASGPSPTDIARKREELALSQALAVAQAAGNQERIRALESEQFLRQRTQEYVEQKYDLETATTMAVRDRMALNDAEIQQAERLNSVKAFEPQDPTGLMNGGQEAGQGLQDQLSGQQAALTEMYATAFEGGLWAAIRGGGEGVAEYFANQLTQALVQDLSQQLGQLLASYQSSQGASGGGFWGQALGFVAKAFTGVGANAGGTSNWRGGLSWVGEKGPELVNLPKGAQVMPAAQSSAMARQWGGGGGGVSFDLRGAVMTEDLLMQMQRMSQAAAQVGMVGGGARGAAAAAAASTRKQSMRIPR